MYIYHTLISKKNLLFLTRIAVMSDWSGSTSSFLKIEISRNPSQFVTNIFIIFIVPRIIILVIN